MSLQSIFDYNTDNSPYVQTIDPNRQNESFVQKLMGSIFGRDAAGNPKKLDLNNYIQPPEVTLKADRTQGIVLAGVALFIGWLAFKKRR